MFRTIIAATMFVAINLLITMYSHTPTTTYTYTPVQPTYCLSATFAAQGMYIWTQHATEECAN